MTEEEAGTTQLSDEELQDRILTYQGLLIVNTEADLIDEKEQATLQYWIESLNGILLRRLLKQYDEENKR